MRLPSHWALRLPEDRGWRSLADRHVVLALLAAVPVWLLLAWTVGGRMVLPAEPAAWISFVLLQPVVEELAFRGVLQGELLRRTSQQRVGPLTAANLWTTAAFAALHLPAQPPAWALAVAVPSLVFGHLRDRLGSVWPAVLVHFVYNAGFGLASWWVHKGPG